MRARGRDRNRGVRFQMNTFVIAQSYMIYGRVTAAAARTGCVNLFLCLCADRCSSVCYKHGFPKESTNNKQKESTAFDRRYAITRDTPRETLLAHSNSPGMQVNTGHITKVHPRNRIPSPVAHTVRFKRTRQHSCNLIKQNYSRSDLVL